MVRVKDGGEQTWKARINFRLPHAVDDRDAALFGADQAAFAQYAVMVRDGGRRHVTARLATVHLALGDQLRDD